jgi:outer membrane murein-binding lipoprotein Lpp
MPDWLLQSVGYVGALAVGYAAIRADLARLHEKAENAGKSAARAHERIDVLLERSHG